jgi:hypothetical protein
MLVYRFGGQSFVNCSIPLAFAGRYFIVEPGNRQPLVSVVLEHDGGLALEVVRNEPAISIRGIASKSATGVVTVVDQATGRFLYKIRPASETSIVFGTLNGGEIRVLIHDNQIRILPMEIILNNNVFDGVTVGVVIGQNGNISIGGSVPSGLRGPLRSA